MDVTFHALYISKHYYTISTLQHVLGGYIVHKSRGSFNNIILNLSHFQIRIWRARVPKVRACLPQAIGEVASNITAYCFPPFPYSLSATILLFILTTLFFPTLEQQSLRQGEFSLLTVGNDGTFSLLTVGYTDIFKYGTGRNFPYSKLATLTISNMAPEGNFPYSQLATLTISNMAPEGRESRDRGIGGGNFILEKRFPPLGYASPLTTCVLSGGCYRLSIILVPCD